MDRVYTIAEVGPHAHGGGWMLRLDDGSRVFCPHDQCSVEPKVGEPCRLQFSHGLRISDIAIGEKPRAYGAVR